MYFFYLHIAVRISIVVSFLAVLAVLLAGVL